MAKTTGKTGGSSRKKRSVYKKLEKNPKQKVRAGVARVGRMLFGEHAPASSAKPVSEISDRAVRTSLRYELNQDKPNHKRIAALQKRHKSKLKSGKKKVK